jgi:hypothetical protein
MFSLDTTLFIFCSILIHYFVLHPVSERILGQCPLPNAHPAQERQPCLNRWVFRPVEASDGLMFKERPSVFFQLGVATTDKWGLEEASMEGPRCVSDGYRCWHGV